MRADVQRGLRTTTWRVAPPWPRWTTRRTGTSSPSRSPVSAGPGPAAADAVSRRRDVPGCQPTAAGRAGVGCGGQGPDVAPGRGT